MKSSTLRAYDAPMSRFIGHGKWELRCQLFDRLERKSDNQLVAIWNRATCPYKPRTDEQHERANKVARLAMDEIRRRRLATRELSNGALMLQ